MNITGAVAETPDSIAEKMYWVKQFLTHLLGNNRAMYRAAMFVLRVDTYKARTMFTPRSRTQKTLWNLIKFTYSWHS